MKVNALKKILKEAVREVFQEELKEMLYESFKSQKAAPIVTETRQSNPQEKKAIRESYMNVLGDMQREMSGQRSPQEQPLQVTSVDTMSPNGKLPEGNVSIDQIMGLMKS